MTHLRAMNGNRGILHALGSLWFAGVLLCLLMVALACATVFETMRGSELALATFYHSRWFALLLSLFAVNIAASVVTRYPFSTRQIGFLLTHVGILVTLAGALTTQYFGVDGQVGIAEGQTVDRFSLRGQETLTLVKRSDGTRHEIDLDPRAFGFEATEWMDGPRHTLGDVAARVVRYVPDSETVPRVVDDNPFPRAALEVSLFSVGHSHPVWVFANQTVRTDVGELSFRRVRSDAELSRILATDRDNSDNSEATVHVTYAAQTYDIPMSDATSAAVPLGETGYSMRVLRYLPHATVDADNKLLNVSNKPVNPAVEVQIVGPEVTETRLAFARFPDFDSTHGAGKIEGLTLRFITTAGQGPTTPIEVIEGPDGQLHARFDRGDGSPMIRDVRVGETIDTPWPERAFTVLRRFKNARREQAVVPIDPVRKQRVPAMLVRLNKRDASSEVWLSKRSVKAVTIDGQAYEVLYGDKQIPIGFEIKLDQFKLGRYPGEMRPRSFESHITIVDATTGRTLDRIVSMNHPVTYGGYTLYQSSYRQEAGKSVTFLSIARDPGQWIAFAGYISTMLGMGWVLVLRMSAQRRMGLPASTTASHAGTPGRGISLSVVASGGNGVRGAPAKEKRSRSGAAMARNISVIVACVLASASARAEPTGGSMLPESLDVEMIRALPVQHNGRWMPLDTVARDTVESVTGEIHHQGRDPVLVLLSWTFDPAKWRSQPLIRIANAEVRSELKLSVDKSVFSYRELVSHEPLRLLIEGLAQKPEGVKPDPLESKVSGINEKLGTLQKVFGRGVIRPIPDPDNVNGAWRAIVVSRPADEHGLNDVQREWRKLRTAFLADDAPAFTTASAQLTDALRALPAAFKVNPNLITTELRYNRLEPFALAWKIMVGGAFLAALAMAVRRKWFDWLALAGLVAGFGALTYGLSLRWQIAGRIPASNMFESLLFLSWGMGAFAIVATFVVRHRIVPLTASGMGAVALLLAACLPMDAFIRPIAPVLLDTVWMSIHVPIIMVSYSVLALAVLVAHVQLFTMAAAPGRRQLIQSIDAMHYWYVHVGALLLLAGIVTGSMWAASSWGRYWGWDPKEVWSLVAFLGYVAILHIRLDHERHPPWAILAGLVLAILLFVIVVPKLGPMNGLKIAAFAGAGLTMVLFVSGRGEFATATKSIVAFWMIIMTYVGVNFVLNTGLHSYGFGTGAVARYMFLLGGVDLAVVALCTLIYLVRAGGTRQGGSHGSLPGKDPTQRVIALRGAAGSGPA